jgi:hypothetical protein
LSALLVKGGHWFGDKTDEEGELMVKELQRKCLNGELQVAIFFGKLQCCIIALTYDRRRVNAPLFV